MILLTIILAGRWPQKCIVKKYILIMILTIIPQTDAPKVYYLKIYFNDYLNNDFNNNRSCY